MDIKRPVDQAPDRRFALLIDADNVSAKYIKPILTELSKYGIITYKRIYGDWTLSLHAKWKDALLENSITPIQQFSYTYGKNSTDSAMIIDAMDILYAGGVEGFCIVSSDSDFTRLASRLRESGRTVIGMGEKKTPAPFRKACDIFTVLELLVKAERGEKGNGPVMSKAEVEQAVVDIIIDNQNNGKATGLGEIGSRMQKRFPDFDVRNYGTNLLSKLLSEFTRVKITKDHSSVAVELVDGGEAEKASEPAQNTHASQGAQADKPASPEKSEKPEKPAKTKKAAEQKLEKPAKAEKPAGDKLEDEPKPSRKPRRRRKLKVSEKTVEEAIEPTEAAEAAKPADPAARAEAAMPATPAATATPATTAAPAEPAGRTPQVLIRERITQAGNEGIALTQLGEDIRAEFKDFKVRDLGFPQLRLYIASVDDFELVKEGKACFAKIKA